MLLEYCLLMNVQLWYLLNSTYYRNINWSSGCSLGYDFDSQTNTCIRVNHNLLSWHDAREGCQADGGYLVTMETREKWEFVTRFIECEYNLHVWWTVITHSLSYSINIYCTLYNSMPLSQHSTHPPRPSELSACPSNESHLTGVLLIISSFTWLAVG